MTKSEFIAKQKILKSYAVKVSCFYVVGAGLFMLWPEHKNLNGIDPLFVTCFFSYVFGGIFLSIWLQIRRQKQIGAFCPKCGKRFGPKSAKIVMAAGKCGCCGETVLTE